MLLTQKYILGKMSRGAFIVLAVLTSMVPLGYSCHGLNAHSQILSRPYEWHVAPMQGYTNFPLRYLFHLLSPDSILWTEMEKMEDLKDADSNALQKRFGTPYENNSNSLGSQQRQSLTLQLGGNDPKALEECVASLGQNGYIFREINLNCGCPSIEAGGAAGFGASLMKKPELTQQLIEAIGNGCQKGGAAATTVSLKCRTAVFETVEEMETSLGTNNYNSGTSNHYNNEHNLSTTTTTTTTTTETWKKQQFQTLCSYISKAQQGGIEHVVLHARPAVLTGLSPTKNRLVPPLDYDVVDAVAAEFKDLRVTLNGGLSSLRDLDLLMQRHRPPSSSSSLSYSWSSQSNRVASHMAGRWMLQRPLELAAIQDNYLALRSNTLGKKNSPSCRIQRASSLSSVLERYMCFVEDSLTNRVHTLSEVCLPLYLITEELRAKFDDVTEEGDREREVFSGCFQASEEACYKVMRDTLAHLSGLSPSNAKNAKAIPDHIHWKKLSSYLKSLVGTKVYNKWKKNRNELL